MGFKTALTSSLDFSPRSSPRLCRVRTARSSPSFLPSGPRLSTKRSACFGFVSKRWRSYATAAFLAFPVLPAIACDNPEDLIIASTTATVWKGDILGMVYFAMAAPASRACLNQIANRAWAARIPQGLVAVEFDLGLRSYSGFVREAEWHRDTKNFVRPMTPEELTRGGEEARRIRAARTRRRQGSSLGEKPSNGGRLDNEYSGEPAAEGHAHFRPRRPRFLRRAVRS